MTSRAKLSALSLDELLERGSSLGIKHPHGHKGHKKTWIDAILASGRSSRSGSNNSSGQGGKRGKIGLGMSPTSSPKKRKVEQEIAEPSGSKCPFLAATQQVQQVSEAVSSADSTSLLGRLSSGVKGLLGFGSGAGSDDSSDDDSKAEDTKKEEEGGSSGSGLKQRSRSSSDDHQGDVSKCPFFNNKLTQIQPSSAHLGNPSYAMSPSSGDRKTLLLTGASRGIGHATVMHFSSMGWRVITCSRQAFPTG
jgi:hypothetical protein